MAIATIISITGQAWARDAEGNLRGLRVGDTLQEGEVLVTSNNGSVQLDFGDGLDPALVEGGEQVVMNPELDADQQVGASDFAALDEDLEALLAALDDDSIDLLDVLDATAAGAGPGGAADGGHSFVRLARIAEDVNPLAFSFGMNALGGPPEEQGGALLLGEAEEVEEPQELVVIPPSAGSFEATLLDVETLSESGSVMTGTLPFSFGNGENGSITFASMHGVENQVGQETIVYSWDASTNTLTAFSPARELNIFTIEVNPATGEITLTQVNNLLHEEGMDEALTSLIYTVTSSSGTTSGTLNITIVDDVPGVELGSVDLSGLELTTLDAETVNGTSTATGSVATAFASAVTASYGADGAGNVVVDGYALSLGEAEHSLTSGGEPIVFTLEDGVVIGTADGVEVLRIEIDAASGEVTVTQSGPVDHPAQGADSVGLPAGLVSVSATVTVTDGDGDTATDTLTVDLGGSITIDDDVPGVELGSVDLSGLELTTLDAETVNGTSTATGSVATAFASAVTASYGADGAGNVVVDGYALSLGEAEHSLTSGGEPIVFTLEDGVVIGTADGVEVLRIEIDAASGEVTVTQSGPVDHPAQGADSLSLPAGLVSVSATVTVTDGDGDTATDTLTADLGGSIIIVDDVPNITLELGDESIGLMTKDADTVSGTGSHSASFAAAFVIATLSHGADGEGSVGWDYSLALAQGVADGVDSGLSSGGQPIYLYLHEGGIVGSTATQAIDVASGNTVFTISVDGDANVTLTQHAAIDHDSADNGDYASDTVALANGLVVLTGTATVVDADGDTASRSVALDLGGNIVFADDGPSLSSLNLAIANVAGTYEGTYEFDIGADAQGFLDSFGEGSLIWTGMPAGYELTLTGSTDTSITYTAQSGSFEFFNLTLYANGTYSFELVSPAPVVETEIESLLSAFDPDGFYKEEGKDAYLFSADVFDGKFELAVEAFSNGSRENVSLSSTDLGVHSNVVQGNKNDMLRFDVRPVDDAGVIGISSFVFSVSGTGGTKAGDQAKLTVYDEDGSSQVYTATLATANGEFVFNIDPSHNVDYMELRPAGNNSFKIDGISTSYVTQIYPDDYQLDFELSGSDADGDLATAAFTVSVKTTEDGTYEITGTDGDDVVHGTEGDDILIGGAGNDTLIGGDGDDVFQWNLGDQGGSAAPAIDTVKDFGFGADVLDLADLLQNESVETIDSFIFAVQEGANTVLYVNHEGEIGADGSNATQVIVLENFSMGDAETSSDFLQEMLNNGQLNIE
ncbi:retention module-containing protein [Billgrantia sp. Q4P2]|uniref:retention module-containing protein n=1 Tax=Billgrantia sp. Q4P2 TaxID=3463857 RepID=UPI004055AFC6